MILKSITPKNFGPFCGDSTLQLDSEVTVLTGPNDVGKSLVLRAIEILCSDRCADQREVNRTRIGEFNGPWKSDPSIVCEAVCEISPEMVARGGIPGDWIAGTQVTVRKPMTEPAKGAPIKEVRFKDSRSTPGIHFHKFPVIVCLPLESSIRDVIDLAAMNEAESQFIRLGFGSQFSMEQHAALDEANRAMRLDEAAEKLNYRIKELFPSTMPMRVRFAEGGNGGQLTVALVDQHQAYVANGSRGAGVRRLLNIMGALLRIDPDDGHTIVLFDEPESSLHADAQHTLRRLLEDLAKHPTIQVVYSTHSPAMINTLRPQSIRVLARKRGKDRAVSEFINDGVPSNYQRVRASLGITPADSLLYAPITLIVEGVTEVRCVPQMLQKLAAAGKLDAQLLEALLSQTHILDGEGSSFEYMCRLAKSQNAMPIVLLDGDQSAALSTLREKHPEVPIVLLDQGTEFEDIVPRSRYMQAAAELLEIAAEQLSEDQFNVWAKSAGLRPTVMFSKRVDRWLRDVFDKSIAKPICMERAIELSEPDEINLRPFEELLGAMRAVSTRLRD